MSITINWVVALSNMMGLIVASQKHEILADLTVIASIASFFMHLS